MQTFIFLFEKDIKQYVKIWSPQKTRLKKMGCLCYSWCLYIIPFFIWVRNIAVKCFLFVKWIYGVYGILKCHKMCLNVVTDTHARNRSDWLTTTNHRRGWCLRITLRMRRHALRSLAVVSALIGSITDQPGLFLLIYAAMFSFPDFADVV